MPGSTALVPELAVELMMMGFVPLTPLTNANTLQPEQVHPIVEGLLMVMVPICLVPLPVKDGAPCGAGWLVVAGGWLAVGDWLAVLVTVSVTVRVTVDAEPHPARTRAAATATATNGLRLMCALFGSSGPVQWILSDSWTVGKGVRVVIP